METCIDKFELIEIQGSVGKETLRWYIWLTLMHGQVSISVVLTPVQPEYLSWRKYYVMITNRQISEKFVLKIVNVTIEKPEI